MASDVYFSDMRTEFGNNLLDKLRKVMERAGIGDIDFKDHYAAIKIHFGEPGNLAFLTPNWAKTVADKIKELGGKPFLTDCNTLYVGGRKNALDHMDTANLNGFNPLSTGCQIIIALRQRRCLTCNGDHMLRSIQTCLCKCILHEGLICKCLQGCTRL